MRLEDPLLFGFGEPCVQRQDLDRIVEPALGQMASEPLARVANIPFGGKEGKDISAPFAVEFIDRHAESIEQRIIVVDRRGVGQALDTTVSDIDRIATALDR